MEFMLREIDRTVQLPSFGLDATLVEFPPDRDSFVMLPSSFSEKRQFIST